MDTSTIIHLDVFLCIESRLHGKWSGLKVAVRNPKEQCDKIACSSTKISVRESLSLSRPREYHAISDCL